MNEGFVRIDVCTTTKYGCAAMVLRCSRYEIVQYGSILTSVLIFIGLFNPYFIPALRSNSIKIYREPHTFKLLSFLWTQFNDKMRRRKTILDAEHISDTAKWKRKVFPINRTGDISYAFFNINAYYITIFIKIFLCYQRPLTEENGQKYSRSINTFTCWNLKKRSFSHSLLRTQREQLTLFYRESKWTYTTTSIKSI